MALKNELTWEFDGTSRIPFGVYTSDELHQRELERFFYRKHWCYVGDEVHGGMPDDFDTSDHGLNKPTPSSSRYDTAPVKEPPWPSPLNCRSTLFG